MTKTFTLICGLPNAGKTTYSKQYKNVIHLDDYKIKYRDRWQDACFKTLRQMKNSMCMEGLAISKEFRKSLVNIAKARNYNTICIFIDTPVDVCIKRCDLNDKGVPKQNIVLYGKLINRPTLEEGWDELKIINNY